MHLIIYVIFVLQSAPFTVNVSPSILVRLFSRPGASFFSCSYHERLAIMFSRIDQCRYNSSSSYSFASAYVMSSQIACFPSHIPPVYE